MKKLFISLVISYLLIGSTIFASEQNKDNKIILESPLLNLIDGKSFGVNAPNFGLLLRQRLDLRRRIYGLVQKDGQRIGFFDFEGKKVTLLDLCEIESKIESEYSFKMNYLAKNESQYESQDLAKERKEIADTYNEKKRALRKLLDFAKEDYIEISAKYAGIARGIKDVLLGLIKEFLEKKGLKDSFLLTWGSLEPEEEEENVRKSLTNFQDFTDFCIELVGFLEAMANSCPKGKALFVEMIRKAKEGK